MSTLQRFPFINQEYFPIVTTLLFKKHRKEEKSLHFFSLFQINALSLQSKM